MRIGGRTFTISKAANTRLSQFIADYNQTTSLGTLVAAMASLFSMFGVFDLSSDFPHENAIFVLGTGDVDEATRDLVLTLSAVNTMTGALRTQALGQIDAEMSLAIAQGRDKDARMWQVLRDVIANPERYKDGGLRIDKTTRQLQLRAPQAERFRTLQGSVINTADFQELRALVAGISNVPQARDFLYKTDFVLTLNTSAPPLALSLRDELLLNRTLRSLSANQRAQLSQRFTALANAPRFTSAFWVRMRKHLADPDAWNPLPGLSYDAYVDELGFEDDMPFPSDLV